MPKIRANYLTTDATGKIGANFTGHVSAAGVDLAVGASLVPDSQDPDHRVRWHEGADPATGGLVAEILASGTAISGTMQAYAEGTDSAQAYHGAGAAIKSSDPNYASRTYAQIQATAYRRNLAARPYMGRVMAIAGGLSSTILQENADGSRSSDFVLSGGGTWRVYGFYSAAYNFPAGSGQSIDVAVDAGILAGQFIPLTANLMGFASDRINAPAYVSVNASTIRITLSTDWAGGAPNGTIWFAILVKG